MNEISDKDVLKYSDIEFCDDRVHNEVQRIHGSDFVEFPVLFTLNHVNLVKSKIVTELRGVDDRSPACLTCT